MVIFCYWLILCYCNNSFLKAETDSINSLEAYRMKSQPTFLFYAVSKVIELCNFQPLHIAH